MLASKKGEEEGGVEQRPARAPVRGTGRPRRRVLSTLPSNGKRARPGSERVTKEGSQEVSSTEQTKGKDSIVTTESETAGANCQMKEAGEPARSFLPALPDTPEETETLAPPIPPVQAPGEGKVDEGKADDNHSFEQPTLVERLPAMPSQEDASPQAAPTPGRPRRNRRKAVRTPAQLDNADLLQLVCESDSEEQPNGKPSTRQEEEQKQEGSQESEAQVAETELTLTSDEDCDEDEEELTEADSDDEYQFFDDPKDENYIPSSESGSDREKRKGRPRRNSVKKIPEEVINRKAQKRRVKRDPSEQPKKIR
ncbi:hypothetical protein scyTo_0021897 [Scyliorhinus torazame]|uniref:Uncharacterized protein n=2 Tax=Scyliorhinus torazame TaxID=75743 RepID=A0A401Q905_SCYTO|nr:hypothetical protein [Scyliorhinus torazame]